MADTPQTEGLTEQESEQTVHLPSKALYMAFETAHARKSIPWLIGILLTGFFLWFGIHSSDKFHWEKYTSEKMGISFEVPQGWDVLFDSAQNADPQLCPPENDRMITRIMYANCITFRTRTRLLHPNMDMDPETEVIKDFPQDVNEGSDKQYNNYRVMRPDVIRDPYESLSGLYRDGRTNMIGIWQQICRKGEGVKCVEIFRHVLDSMRFTR